MIKPWIFEFCSTAAPTTRERFDPQSCAADYEWYLQRWVQAEQLGFEGIFFSEHHFVAGRYSPSPNILIANVAARTRRMRLGTMGNVVPFYEPWRLAEEYSMLDYLTGGRLEIGYSSGIGPMEFRPIGMPAEEVKPRFAEGLDIIDAALTRPEFSHHGKFWHFDRLGISPRPLQQPAPPRWMTGISVPTAQMAAQRDYKFCTGFLATQQVRQVFEAYRARAAELGRTTQPDQFALRRMILIGDDDAATRAIADQALQRMRAYMSGPPPGVTAAPASGVVAPDAPRPAPRVPFIADEEFIAGSPARVIEQIVDQCGRCGAGHIVGYPVANLPRELVGRSYELWAEVIPVLRRIRLAA
jgi:alkanesulfonate monooxygenase SsuD/methylene tetrahydromethanopterin reductase-like flavin-dependent oxidoreductase (luciferase family)